MIPRKPHTLRFENGPTGPRKRFCDGERASAGQSPINNKTKPHNQSLLNTQSPN